MSNKCKYTAQQFITYLQSIKKFENFDESTLILQSHSAHPCTETNIASSLNIRITDHQHITLHAFITDCIIICNIHSDPQYKYDETEASIMDMNDILSLSKSFLLSFYNAFFRFLSILTQIFDENIVSTKLRIRGPYLLMMNKACMCALCCFLLSQIITIQNNMKMRANTLKYEMHLKEMKNLRYCIHLMKSLLQFELFTFDFVGFEVISNMVLFSQHETLKDWSKSLVKLFDVALMIKVPTTSLGMLSKFTVDKLILLERKALLTTKAFRSFVVAFIRFLVVHYHHKIMSNMNNHIDAMMNALFEDHEDIMTQLWGLQKLQTEFSTEYETKQKYQSSAFLKGIKQEIMTNKTRLHGNNDNDYMKEQCYLLIVDVILPFCMDFNSFYQTNHDDMMRILNDILLYFIKKEKWWYLRHIMLIYNDLFEDKTIFKHYLKCLHDGNDWALNIKYGIYSFMIWISYIHQITPKPVICFFDEDFDPNKALETRKREKLMNKDERIEVFDTLKSVQIRVTELSLAKAVLIKLLVTVGDEWLIHDITQHFSHIRDQYVVVKLLMILLHDIHHLEINNVLDHDDNYLQQFIKIFHHFKRKILCNINNNNAQNKADEIRPKPLKRMMKSKIVFRTQHKSKLIKLKPSNKANTKNKTNNSKNTEQYQDIRRDHDNKPIFEHFTAQSMKIVECIVNDKKHLLYQFVTSSNSKGKGKGKSNNKNNTATPIKTIKTMKTKKEERSNDLSVDITMLSSTLSSIGTALDIPQNNDNDEMQDFHFDFQRISNIEHNMEPPKKKQKIMTQDTQDTQLADLLSYLCDDNDNDKHDNVPPRYPRPKAPTLAELDTDGNEDSNWTNVINLNKY